MSKILIIDDDAPFREMVAMVLEEEGFEALEAANGQEGVELARGHLPGLIICDVHMHQMDGYATLAELRNQAGTATIPFILMTGMADNHGMREGMNLGADDYLIKPFSIDELIAAVNARLQKHQVMQKKAEEKVEALRTSMALTLPHEVYTPLTSILTSAQILMELAEAMTPDEVREMAGHIHGAGERLQRLVEHSLVYAQIEMIAADEQQAALLKGGLTPNVRHAIEASLLQKAQHADRVADLVLQLSNAPVAMADHFLITVVEELLDNAFKFSDPSTPIQVETFAVAEGICLFVKDRGCGMSTQQVADVGAFMQFERAYFEQQGAGLGLQIVRRLVELHDGHFRIESTPGEGTVVTVDLPGPYEKNT